MKSTIIKSVTLASFILVSGFANADTVITPKQAKRFYDEIKTVCGRVKASTSTEVIDGNPTFLRFGRSYPNETFVVVVWEQARQELGFNPETLTGDDVCATGKITRIQRKPHIEVFTAAQLVRIVE